MSAVHPHRSLCPIALFLAALCGSGGTSAQGYIPAAELSPDMHLTIPVLEAGDKFFEVLLVHQPPAWVLAEARPIAAVDEDYVSAHYSGGVLDLVCVRVGRTFHSARLVNTSAQGHSFTLRASAKLASCPVPADLGPVRGAWVRTAQAPLGPRVDPVIAWTGEEILVIGGGSAHCGDTASCAPIPLLADGAAYRPATDSWRRIADAPAGLGGQDLVRLGNEIFVLAPGPGESRLRLWRYRIAQDRWDEVGMPAGAAGTTLAGFGGGLVLYGNTDTTGTMVDWRFDPVTARWTALPPAPVGPSSSRRYLGVGSDLYLFHHALTARPGGADGPSLLRAARLRGPGWTLLPAADSIGAGPDLVSGARLIAPALGCGDGGSVNNYGRCIPYGAVFDTATDSWQPLPDAPGTGIEYLRSAGAIGADGLVLMEADRPALDATTGQWFRVPALDGNRRRVQAAGPYGFSFGGALPGGEVLNDAWIWQP